MTSAERAAALALAGWLAIAAGSAWAADSSEIQKAYAAVGVSTSDAAALREVQAASPAYRAGAALAAWRNASASLDYDVKNPSGDGVGGAVSVDCFDEKAAFADLELGRLALNLPPAVIVARAGITESEVITAWLARQAAPPAACG